MPRGVHRAEGAELSVRPSALARRSQHHALTRHAMGGRSGRRRQVLPEVRRLRRGLNGHCPTSAPRCASQRAPVSPPRVWSSRPCRNRWKAPRASSREAWPFGSCDSGAPPSRASAASGPAIVRSTRASCQARQSRSGERSRTRASRLLSGNANSRSVATTTSMMPRNIAVASATAMLLGFSLVAGGEVTLGEAVSRVALDGVKSVAPAPRERLPAPAPKLRCAL